jgi:hypothetical protein
MVLQEWRPRGRLTTRPRPRPHHPPPSSSPSPPSYAPLLPPPSPRSTSYARAMAARVVLSMPSSPASSEPSSLLASRPSPPLRPQIVGAVSRLLSPSSPPHAADAPFEGCRRAIPQVRRKTNAGNALHPSPAFLFLPLPVLPAGLRGRPATRARWAALAAARDAHGVGVRGRRAWLPLLLRFGGGAKAGAAARPCTGTCHVQTGMRE